MKILLVVIAICQTYSATCLSNYKQLINVSTQINLINPDTSMLHGNVVLSKEYYKNGNPKYEGYLLNSYKTGIWACYDSFGIKISACYWKFNTPNSSIPWKGTNVIWKGDTIIGLENIELGLRHGERLKFDGFGNLIQRDSFNFDKLSGVRKCYYENGNIYSVDTIVNGKRQGSIRRWFINGQEEDRLSDSSIKFILVSDSFENRSEGSYLNVKIKNLTNRFQAIRFEGLPPERMPNFGNSKNVTTFKIEPSVFDFRGNWVCDNEDVLDGNIFYHIEGCIEKSFDALKVILPPQGISDVITIRFVNPKKNIHVGQPLKIGFHPFETDKIFWSSAPAYFK